LTDFKSTRGMTFAQVQGEFPEVVDEIERQVRNGKLIPYRRRDFERDDMMVKEIVRRAAASGHGWAIVPTARSGVPSVMRNAAIFIVHNQSGSAISDTIEEFMKSRCRSVCSSGMLGSSATLIDEATHIVVVLTKDAVTPGQQSVEHLQHALQTRRPIQYIFKRPFFEQEKHKAPEDIKRALNNNEALHYHDLQYEQQAMLEEVMVRLSKGFAPPNRRE